MHLEDAVRDSGVVPLPLYADPHVVVVLAESSREHVAPLRLPLAVEVPGPRGSGGQAGELGHVVCRYREEARAGTVAGGDEDRAEFLLERHQLAHQGHGRDSEARAMEMGQREHVEELERATGEELDPARRWQATQLFEVTLYARQVPDHTLALRPVHR